MAVFGNNVLFNVGAMALNTSVTYLIGDERGLALIGENFSHKLKSNKEVSKKYDTPITPVGSTFAIWGPIFIGENLFTIYQAVTPHTPMITELSPWWQGACVAQTAWSVAFARESILPCQFLLPIVAGCMYKAYNIASAGASSPLETWLIAVPFGLHATWGLFAALLQQNLAARKANNRRPLFGFGLEYPSLFLATGLAAALSLKVESPLPALVALWSLRGIQKRSEETMPQIKTNPKEWGLDSGIASTAGVLAAVSAGLAVFITARLHL